MHVATFLNILRSSRSSLRILQNPERSFRYLSNPQEPSRITIILPRVFSTYLPGIPQDSSGITKNPHETEETEESRRNWKNTKSAGETKETLRIPEKLKNSQESRRIQIHPKNIRETEVCILDVKNGAFPLECQWWGKSIHNRNIGSDAVLDFLTSSLCAFVLYICCLCFQVFFCCGTEAFRRPWGKNIKNF